MKKEVVIFDIDNTLIKGYSQKILLSYLFKKKVIKLLPYLKIYFWFILYKLKLVNNPKKAMEYAYNFLKGRTVNEFDSIIDNFFEEELKYFIFKEGIDLINEHKFKNRELILVSAIVEPIVKKFSQYFDIKNYLATYLEIKNDKYTGKINGDIDYGEKKVHFIKEYFKKHNLTLENSWAYGDHQSDIPVLEIANHSIAVNPDSLLLKEAKIRNWPILIFKKTI